MFYFKTVDIEAISQLPLDLIEEVNARIKADTKVAEEQQKEAERKAKRRGAGARRGRRKR